MNENKYRRGRNTKTKREVEYSMKKQNMEGGIIQEIIEKRSRENK